MSEISSWIDHLLFILVAILAARSKKWSTQALQKFDRLVSRPFDRVLVEVF